MNDDIDISSIAQAVAAFQQWRPALTALLWPFCIALAALFIAVLSRLFTTRSKATTPHKDTL